MREAGWKHERSHFYLHQTGKSVGSALKSDALVPRQQHKRRPASAGTLGERGRSGDEVELHVLGCRLTNLEKFTHTNTHTHTRTHARTHTHEHTFTQSNFFCGTCVFLQNIVSYTCTAFL